MIRSPVLRRCLVWSVRLVVGIVALFLVAEVGLRLFDVHAQMPLFCSWNPRIGCVTWPDRQITMGFGAEQFTFHTGPDGLRNGAIAAKQPGRRRVLVLGDSVVFAPTVPDGEPFANQLNGLLQSAGIDVINAGAVYLRATDQQLSWFLDIGAAFHPDLVLLTFTERNDFVENQQEYWWRPGAHGLERQLDVRPPGLHRAVVWSNDLSLVRWLDAHSRAFGLVRLLGWNTMHLPRIRTDGRWREATEAVLVQLQEVVAARGAKLAVVVYPSPEQLAPQRGEQQARSSHDLQLTLDILQAHQVPFLDLTPAMSTPAGQGWQDPDGHLTLAGHRAVAALLAPQIQAWLGQP